MTVRPKLYVLAVLVILVLAVIINRTIVTVPKTVVASGTEQTISPKDAIHNVGARRTVCGDIKSTRYANRSRGKPTFLNLDKPYPNQVFTIVIWGQHRNKFSQAPESLYKDKNVCVTGRIETYKSVPQIEATSPSQIKSYNNQ